MCLFYLDVIDSINKIYRIIQKILSELILSYINLNRVFVSNKIDEQMNKITVTLPPFPNDYVINIVKKNSWAILLEMFV